MGKYLFFVLLLSIFGMGKLPAQLVLTNFRYQYSGLPMKTVTIPIGSNYIMHPIII